MRNANGEGSLYKRDSDGLWVATFADTEGRRKVVYGKTQAEARAKRAEKLARVTTGGPLTDSRQTFAQWAEVWIPTTLEASTRATKTKDELARMVRVHAVAWFGNVELGKLRPQHLEKMIVGLRAGKRPGQPDREPYAAWSVRKAVQAAKAATADAVRDGLLARDPFDVVHLPKASSQEARFLTPAEAQAFLRAVTGERLEAMWVTMLGLGLRRGEVIGLRWSAMDLDAGQLWIRRSVGRVRGQRVEGETKSHRSKRPVPLPAFVVEALRAHRKRQTVERLAAARWDDPDIVFASSVGTFMEPRRVNVLMAKVCRRAGLVGVHPHTLRHSTAVALLAAGEPLPVISEILGHGSAVVTATIYSHVLPSSRISAAATLDRAFGGLSDVATDVATA